MNTPAINIEWFETDMDYSDYIDYLIHEKSLRDLGEGCWGTVFEHPTDKNIVVKVFDREDNAYFAYLKWAVENQSNVYAPKIYSAHESDSIGIVFMERLEPLGPKQFKNFSETHFKLDTLRRSYVSSATLMDNTLLSTVAYKESPDFRSLLRFLMDVARDGRYVVDLHDGNAMMRGNQVVVTDPICPN